MDQITNICIYGVGGVGGYFGAKIIDGDKNKSLNVTFIARGNNLEAIKKNGLALNTEDRIIKVKPNLATENVHDVEK